MLTAKRRANGEGSIIKRSDGRWSGAYYANDINGKRSRHYIYGKTKTEAAKKLRQKLKEIDDGHIAIYGDETLLEYYVHWKNNIAHTYLKPTTIEIYNYEIAKYVLPAIGNKQLSSITPLDIQNLLAYISRSANCPRHAQCCKVALSSVMKTAKNLRKITQNPVLGTTAPRAKPKEPQLWTQEQLNHFLTVAKKTSIYYPIYVILSTYGLRRGECLGLRYEDIKLKDGTDGDYGTIHIKQQVVVLSGKPTIMTPKTKTSIRELPITANIASVLKEYMNKDSNHSGLLFHTRNNTCICPNNFRRNFLITIKKAGLPHIKIHTLRHMACTHMRDAGVDIKTAQLLMGHSDPATTLKIYQHSDMDDKREAMEKLSQLLHSH